MSSKVWISTPFLMISIALASLIVGVALQRIVQLIYLSSTANANEDLEEGVSQKKAMTYDEAMQALAKVRDAEPFRRRRKKRKAKPEPVLLDALRYGEYHTDDSKLKIQSWRPDPTHRLAGHVVIDIIPKSDKSTSSVRRLAIDLDTVEATRLVTLRNGSCLVLAVRDYEVKGQGVIFKDLEYSKDVGVDDTTLYVVLVVRHAASTNLPSQGIHDDDQQATEESQQQRLAAFHRLAKGLSATSAAAGGFEESAQQQQQQPLVAKSSAKSSSSSSQNEPLSLPDVDVDRFFSEDFAYVF